MATKREYLIGLGLAKPTRGKFSKEAHAALAEAEANGVTFDEAVKPVKEVATDGADAPSERPQPTSEASKVRAWAAQNGIKVGERGRIPSDVLSAYSKNDVTSVATTPKPTFKVEPQVRVRQVSCMYGTTEEGYTVGFGFCRKCVQHVSFCRCVAGPRPPKMVVKVLDRTDPLVIGSAHGTVSGSATR